MRTLVALMVVTASAAAGLHAASFSDDLAFLKNHTKVIVLSDDAGTAKVAVGPSLQGRVLTSTAAGDDGLSFGWINRELFASGKLVPHMNAFGGEDRFWMGPEGGQFSVYFKKGQPFDFNNWFVPAAFDTEAYDVLHQSSEEVVLGKTFTLTNYSGTHFTVAVQRTVRLLTAQRILADLKLTPPPGLKVVAFESENRITNVGDTPWNKSNGLLSVWILGQFTPSAGTTVIVPIKSGPESQLGAKVRSDYFGEIPDNRLVVKADAIFFAADGKFRSKIGINPKRSKRILGSYDSDNRTLTLVTFSQPADVTDYVNSLWHIQKNPFGGDAANSYNDGPATPGAKPMGPFYELESSSPAASLAPGKTLTHVHRTIHFSGDESQLDVIARAALGVSLAEIKTALPRP